MQEGLFESLEGSPDRNVDGCWFADLLSLLFSSFSHRET